MKAVREFLLQFHFYLLKAVFDDLGLLAELVIDSLSYLSCLDVVDVVYLLYPHVEVGVEVLLESVEVNARGIF